MKFVYLSLAVIMLSGFLGAGKTTLLRHLLTHTDRRIACIVNDVAQINIDAKLIRSTQTAASTAAPTDLTDTLELSNGCACCSLQDELFDSFRQILTLSDRNGQRYDAIVLENSGVAEPQNIRDLFQTARTDPAAFGADVVARTHLARLVTVVDAATFTRDYASRTAVAGRPELGDGGNLRPVVDLLVEQVECADVLVLNKADTVDEARMTALNAVVAALNPLATVTAASWGKVDLYVLLGNLVGGSASLESGVMARLTVEGQHREALDRAHAHRHAGEGSHGSSCHDTTCSHPDHHHHHHHHDSPTSTAASKYGITTFVYTARRPFHPQRLRAAILSWIPAAAATPLAESGSESTRGDENQLPSGTPTTSGTSPLRRVLRSKGFVWMAGSHNKAHYWSHAGQHFEVREEGDWWDGVPREEWPADEAGRMAITRDFAQDARVGDRRVEVIFIGQGMDEGGIRGALEACLLTDEEMLKYWARWDGV